MADWTTLNDLAAGYQNDDSQHPVDMPAPEALGDNQSPTWTDWARTFGWGTDKAFAAMQAGGKYIAELVGDGDTAAYHELLRSGANDAAEQQHDALTLAGKKYQDYGPMTAEFWKHPVGSSVAQMIGMSPQLLMTLVPGAALGESMAGVAGVMLAGGALSSGQALDEFYSKVDKISDDELKQQSKVYAGLRTIYDEKEARRQFDLQLQGIKPAINFALGSAVASVGPAGIIARGGVLGATEKGLLGRAGTAAAENAVGGALQGGVADATTQSALMEGGVQKEFDSSELANAILEPGFMGGVMGGVGGALAGGKGRAARRPEDVNQSTKGAGTGPGIKPSEDVPVGNTESAPTRSDTRYPKGNQEVADGSRIVSTDTVAPDQAVALATKQAEAGPAPQVPEIPPEVLQASQRLTQGAPAEALPTDVAPQRVPDAPPPDVVQAAQRVQQPQNVTSGVTPDLAPQARPVLETPAAPEIKQAMPPPDQRAGRVLEAQDDQAVKNKIAQQRQIDKNLTEPAEKVTGKHRTEAEVQARADNAQKAADLFNEMVPETRSTPTQPKHREALLADLSNVLAQAQERGVDIPQRPGRDENASHLMWLRDAQKLVQRKKPPSYADLVKFIGREKMIREGNAAEVRAERMAEGDMAMRRDQGDVDAPVGDVAEKLAVHETPEDILARKQEEGDAGQYASEEEAYAAGRERPRRAVPKTEAEKAADAKATKVEELAKRGATEGERKAAEAALQRVASKASGAEYVARQDQAGKFKVEGKRDRFKGMKPKAVEAIKRAEHVQPTEAQKAAGNYPKEHIKLHGLDISIENPRGSERSGTDPTGKKWSVKMPDHYGYIRRTEGADGDHVDVYVGKHPESERAVVIHQVDPDTRKPDEHKVMLGYRNQREALEAYDKAFSDGRGMERVGHVEDMPISKFKDWLKNDDTTDVKTADEETPRYKVDALDEPADGEVRGTTGERVRPIYTTKLHTALKSLKVGDLEGIGGKVAPFVRSRLLQYVKDMPFHVLNEEDMAKFAGRGVNEQGPMGLHLRNTRTNESVMVAIRADMVHDPKEMAHVTMHEAVHAATAKAIDENPSHYGMISELMAQTERLIYDRFDGAMPREAGYAFKNPHEFIAEAFSSPKFQDLLASLQADRYIIDRVGLREKSTPTVWDVFVASVRHILHKVLGLPRESFTMLEATMRVGESLMTGRRGTWESPFDAVASAERLLSQVREQRKAADHLVDALDYDRVKDRVVSAASDHALNVGAAVRRAGDWASSMWMLANRARTAGHEFAGHMMHVVEAKAMMEREKFKVLETEGGLQVVNDLAAYRRDRGDAAFNDLANLGFDASNLNVNLGKDADNSHLGKDATKGWQAKAKLDDLNKRFAALPPEGQALLERAVTFYRTTHNEMALQAIKNVLHAAGRDEPGLAERIFRDGLTDADKDKFKTDAIVNALNNARELKQLNGWYLPFRRYGEHIISGEYGLAEPKDGIKLSKDTVQFTDPKGGTSDERARRAAEQYVAGHDLRHVETRSVWVDRNDPTKVVEAEDTNAIPAYRLRMQVQHTEFHETPADARAAEQRLHAEGLTNITQRTRRDEATRNSSLMSGDLKTLVHSLEQQPRFKAMSKEEQDGLRQALMETSVRVLGSSKIQSSFIQRRNVAGMSNDLVRVTADYARSSAGYLAKLRFQPQVDDAFKALDKYIDEHKYEAADKVKRRDELRNELSRRFREDAVYTPQTGFAKATRRLLQISRLDKLAGVSFHVINAQEPWTTSLPVIGGRHGFARSAKALFDAYNLIGGRGAITSGLKDTVRAFRQDTGFTDYIENFKHEIAASGIAGGDKARRLMEMLDYNQKRGLFSDEAIFEVGRYADPTKNMALRGLDRADLMANQVGGAIEKINRAVTALAAYELEFKRTGNHEAAMAYSHEVARDTMGDYSTWNAAPAFKHPVGQLALQFKKFAHKTYYLLGKTFRGAIHGDMEAAKQFGGLMVTHMVVAGALGLPLEPFKVALMAGNWFGVTGYTWTDVENVVRTLAANVLGVKGGEAFSHGLTRLISIDTSTRQGLDSLLTFGAPRSEKPQDIKAWLFDTMAGAPAGYLLDQIKTAQSLSKGDIVKAAETFVPIKAAVDITKAWEGMAPQQNKSGRQTMRGYSPYEAATQALGFTPAAKVENYEKQSYYYQTTQRDKDQRSALMSKWATAAAADKAKVWAEVRQWNMGRAKDSQITMKDLSSAAKRRTSDAKNYDGAMRVTKRDRATHDRLSIYDTQ